ncbi:MAG: hypothetical protein WA667_18845 [Candidatus Nitrosopolaris sp.]
MNDEEIIGPDGVQQIYPKKPGGTEFYLNMDNPYDGGAYTSRPTAQFNISFGKNSRFPFTTHIDDTQGLIYFNTTGSPISYQSGGSGRSVRLDVNAKPTLTISNPPPLADNGQWIGLKTVHKIGQGYSDWEVWVDVVSESKPNCKCNRQ